MDLLVRVSHQPRPGETLLGGDLESHHGGKGANQAVAASRAGGRVRMLGCVGKDTFGSLLKAGLEREGVLANRVEKINTATGVAIISLDDAGQNAIIVSPGANAQLRPSMLRNEDFTGAKVVLLQLEIPTDVVAEAARMAKNANATVVLNAAPVQELSEELLRHIDILVVNEIEASELTGGEVTDPQSALEVARGLRARVPSVVITLGNQGAVWSDVASSGHVPAPNVNVVDTTAAGDAFIGAMAVALANKRSLQSALPEACAAGSLACTKAGAQGSLPTRAEISVMLAQQNQFTD